MPNWCYTKVIFEGENIETLHNDILESMKEPYEGDEGWLGNLFKFNSNIFGTMERIMSLIENREFYLRSFICDVELKKEENILILILEEAWHANFDPYMLIANTYDLKFYLYAEEFGCEVYINTDEDGKYCDTRYRLAYEGEEDEEREEYFAELEEVLKYINQEGLLEENLSLKEINNLLEDYEIYEYDSIVEPSYSETLSWINRE